ncbi:MAG: hypothetical protein IKQ68_04355 [Prevotella sp.]|nr:hypothetical protein [Prevotella sp.]
MRLCVSILTLLCSVAVSAQVLLTGHINERLLQGRVKQVEEFMARFNGDEDWQGGRMTVSDSIMRTKYLRTLFDHRCFPMKKGVIENGMAEQFIREVTESGVRLDYTDKAWQAEVDCRCVKNDTAFSATLTMRTVKVGDCEYRWEVVGMSDARMDVFSGLRLSPVEHEAGFTALLSMRLPVRVRVVSSVRFVFHTVPNYTFTVERIEKRNSYNTGWLITSLIRNEE